MTEQSALPKQEKVCASCGRGFDTPDCSQYGHGAQANAQPMTAEQAQRLINGSPFAYAENAGHAFGKGVQVYSYKQVEAILLGSRESVQKKDHRHIEDCVCKACLAAESVSEPSQEGSDSMPETANFMQSTGEGVCFAHGPYKNADRSANCPKWPACITDPQKEEYKKLAMRERQGSAREWAEQMRELIQERLEPIPERSCAGEWIECVAEQLEAFASSRESQLVQPLKDACDRDWKDETPQQSVTIAANAIYWRGRGESAYRAALERYGKHLSYCTRAPGGNHVTPCNCGFEWALSGSPAGPQKQVDRAEGKGDV